MSEQTIRLGNSDVKVTAEGNRLFLTPEPGATNLLAILDDAAHDICAKLPTKFGAQAYEERNGIVIDTKGAAGIDWADFSALIRASLETAFNQSGTNASTQAAAAGTGNTEGRTTGMGYKGGTGGGNTTTDEAEALKTG